MKEKLVTRAEKQLGPPAQLFVMPDQRDVGDVVQWTATLPQAAKSMFRNSSDLSRSSAGHVNASGAVAGE
jgi:hypothetical protein